MEEKNIIEEDIKKPLIEIDNDLTEMSKNLKIINSLKDDIEKLIIDLSNSNNNEIISSIKDKHNKIKNQIKKFMNKKKFIYNYIDNEKLSKKNIVVKKNIEEENETLIEEDNKLESIKENINNMQKKIINLINKLDTKLSQLNIFEKKDELNEEITKNDIINDKEENEPLSQEQYKIKSSLLKIKAEIYNEEAKELEKANKMMDQIKIGTREMKLLTGSQGNTINNLMEEHNYIGNKIEKGIGELKEYNSANQNNNSKLIYFICFVILLIIIFSCLLYYKFKNKK